MKVAITGANGFVGQAVYRRMQADGHVPLAIVRAPSGISGEVVSGDLAQARFVPGQLDGIDAVIHLAARTHVMDETAPDALGAYRAANVEGTRAILDAAIAAGAKRFVFMSSVKAMGERTQPGAPFTPETTPRPEDAYGVSKLEAETLVRERCEAAGVEWTILRPPLVHGPGVKANFARLVALVARQLPLPLGSLRNRRSIVHVDNLAAAAVQACQAPGAANRLLLIADATLSTPELIRAIATAAGVRARLVQIPPMLLNLAGRLTGKQAMVERLCGSLELDVAASWEALGSTPDLPPDAAIRQTVLALHAPNAL